MKRPFALYILGLLLMFVGANGIAGGLLLMLSPDGSRLGMNAGWLEASPFHSYLVPGLILLVCNGIFPLFVLFALFAKPSWKFAGALNIYRDRFWAWTYSLYSGIILMIWITVQLMMTPSFWLQPVLLLFGIAIVVCTLLPPVMRYFSRNPSTPDTPAL